MSLGSSLASEGICLFVDLWEAQPCLETQNEIVVSLLRVCRKFGPKLASHYKPVENKAKVGLSETYSAN